MARYNMYFDTPQGELQYKVTIPDDSTLAAVLPDLLIELEEKGYRLDGGGQDTLRVLWNGRELDQNSPLAEQGVRPQDNLRVRAQARQQQREQSVQRQEPPKPSSDSSAGLKVLYVFVAFFPIWVIHYVGLRGGNPLVWAGTALLGCGIAMGLWYFSESSSRGLSQLIPFVTVLCGIGLAILAAQAGAQLPSMAWATVLPTVVVGVIGGLKTRGVNKATCLIGGELFSGVQFTCPRCGRVSCATHWDVRNVRCTNCNQRDILWLSLMGQGWWDDRLGPTIDEGQCARCRSGPETRGAFREQKDLRECGGCGMLQCRWCWDLTNGVCADEQNCGWTMPDLPSVIATMSDRQAAGRRRR